MSDRGGHVFGAYVSTSLLLPLTDYERDLSRRLALSQKTEPSVKQMARLLLEMGRQPTSKQAVERLALPSESAATDIYPLRASGSIEHATADPSASKPGAETH